MLLWRFFASLPIVLAMMKEAQPLGNWTLDTLTIGCGMDADKCSYSIGIDENTGNEDDRMACFIDVSGPGDTNWVLAECNARWAVNGTWDKGPNANDYRDDAVTIAIQDQAMLKWTLFTIHRSDLDPDLGWLMGSLNVTAYDGTWSNDVQPKDPMGTGGSGSMESMAVVGPETRLMSEVGDMEAAIPERKAGARERKRMMAMDRTRGKTEAGPMKGEETNDKMDMTEADEVDSLQVTRLMRCMLTSPFPFSPAFPPALACVFHFIFSFIPMQSTPFSTKTSPDV
jgi:hypothetical protein